MESRNKWSGATVDSEYYGGSGACADVWVAVDIDKKLLSVSFLGDLFEFLTETNYWTQPKPEPVYLRETFWESLQDLVPFLEKFFDACLVKP